MLIGIQGYEERARIVSLYGSYAYPEINTNTNSSKFHESLSSQLDLWTSSSSPSSQIPISDFSSLTNLESELSIYQRSQRRSWETELGQLKELLGNVQAKLFTYDLRGYEPPEPLRSEVSGLPRIS